jgi:hypothetical protein
VRLRTAACERDVHLDAGSEQQHVALEGAELEQAR